MTKRIEGILSSIRFNMLFNEGIKRKVIFPFDENLYKRLNNIYFYGATGSIIIKYLKPLRHMIGNFDDKCLLLTMVLMDAKIVKGYVENHTGKEIRYWVESGNSVYDVSLLYRFKKKIYYRLFKPNDIVYFGQEDYINETYFDIKNTTLEDLNYNIVKRVSFCILFSLIEGLSIESNNKEFRCEARALREFINYKDFNLDNYLSHDFTRKLN